MAFDPATLVAVNRAADACDYCGKVSRDLEMELVKHPEWDEDKIAAVIWMRDRLLETAGRWRDFFTSMTL